MSALDRPGNCYGIESEWKGTNQIIQTYKILLSSKSGDVNLQSSLPDESKEFINCHKFILSSQSSVLANLMECCNESADPTNLANNNPVIPLPFRYATLTTIVQYIYYGGKPSIQDYQICDFFDVLGASEFLELPNALESYLQQTFINWLSKVFNSQTDLIKNCRKFLEYFNEVSDRTPKCTEKLWTSFASKFFTAKIDYAVIKDPPIRWETVFNLVRFANTGSHSIYERRRFDLLLGWLLDHDGINNNDPQLLQNLDASNLATRSDDSINSTNTGGSSITESDDHTEIDSDYNMGNNNMGNNRKKQRLKFNETTQSIREILRIEKIFEDFVWESCDVSESLTVQGRNRLNQCFDFLNIHKWDTKDLEYLERKKVFSAEQMLKVYRKREFKV